MSSSLAGAKDYKSGEYITTHRYGFGAFEARIRAARGPGVISTFFLWKPGSETAPNIPWEEIDFELGPAGGDYQTQIMTPGSSPPLYRTEHVVFFDLPSRPWDAYYTYRIEWTPSYIAFFLDGQEVRRETNQQEFAALFNTDANGNTPIDERMELRTGAWPGAPSIAGWSGVFDGSSVPTGHFVDYVKVWAYTPGQADHFATLLLDDEFNRIDTSFWYFAQWTFTFSASDYISQNIGTRDGRLVVALTTSAGQGILPDPTADLPPPVPAPGDGGTCPMSCDDGNACTTDSCDPVAGCQFQNNTLPCTDDGDPCTNDVCGAGMCTHVSSGTCNPEPLPCSGLCANPVEFGSNNFSSGNLGTGATCHQTTANLNGGVCGNLASGRHLTVNGVPMSCTGNWPNPLPAKRHGGYCVQTTAGDYPWAYFVTW